MYTTVKDQQHIGYILVGSLNKQNRQQRSGQTLYHVNMLDNFIIHIHYSHIECYKFTHMTVFINRLSSLWSFDWRSPSATRGEFREIRKTPLGYPISPEEFSGTNIITMSLYQRDRTETWEANRPLINCRERGRVSDPAVAYLSKFAVSPNDTPR